MKTAAGKKYNPDQFEEILVYFSNSIHGKNNEDEILWDLAKNCIAKLDFVDCVVYLVDEEGNCLLQKAAYGPKNPKAKEIYKPIEIAIGQGISGHVAQTGQAEIITDTTKDPRYLEDDEFRYSEICVPIKIDGKVLGVIDCEHPEKDYYTPQHLRILSAVASICAFKIQNVRADLKIKKEREKVFQIEKEMVQLKLKAFRSQMNPHFIFNSLSGIQYYITTSNKKQALGYLSLFSKLMRFYLKYFEKESVGLKDETAMLDTYLKLQKMRYGNRFSYEMGWEKNSVGKEAVIPSFVLQTFFENIIENAVYNQYENCSIKVLFNVKPSKVLVKIGFKYKEGKENKAYAPDYREQFVKWEDQIGFLNEYKNYQIEKKITFNKNDEWKEGEVFLSLPNL
jgi:putative methionine-R-sulfoxide reductase with GAF domain